jgi:endonuclease YncB( thermonuclease family)
LDRDTVAVDFRLLGVDAFERKQLCARDEGCWKCGKLALDVAAKEVHDQLAVIRLTPRSTYGRPVVIVTVGDQDLGETMIRSGVAIPETKYLRSDPARAARYEAAFAAARTQDAGAFAGN